MEGYGNDYGQDHGGFMAKITKGYQKVYGQDHGGLLIVHG